jgi:hypothetical protein
MAQQKQPSNLGTAKGIKKKTDLIEQAQGQLSATNHSRHLSGGQQK